MTRVAASIKWIMLVSGLLTCTMFYAAVAPAAALTSTFGATIDGPLANIVVRNWGALVGMVGLALIYGAFNLPARRLALMMAVASKVVFIGLILVLGREFLAQAMVPVVVDSIMVLVFLAYLVSGERSAS